MNIVHITAHLGGGVGKAHSALSEMASADLQHQYLLLEEPRDRRYCDAIAAAGASVRVASDNVDVRRYLEKADVVQIEWWNHPLLYQFLCNAPIPASRTVIWSHISGLSAPYVPPALMAVPHRFLFTSTCSLEAAALRSLTGDEGQQLAVINSGYGFSNRPATTTMDAVGYLGTVDFAKLSPQFFDVIDSAELDRPVQIWGAVESEGEVVARAAAMRRPHAVRFRGHADDAEAALREIGVFLYLLQPEHFGTAENALIEAMSLGCVPLVFDNPAERAIVEHGRTGFVERDVAAAVSRLRWMLDHPAELRKMGAEAARAVAATRSVELASAQFDELYRAMLGEDRREIDFSAVLGLTPADWFLSTQGGAARGVSSTSAPRKGSLAHFAQCFPDDPSLERLTADER